MQVLSMVLEGTGPVVLAQPANSTARKTNNMQKFLALE